MEILLLFVMIAAIVGVICSAIAHSKGRSAVGWFFAGFGPSLMSPCIGIVLLIVIIALSNLKEEQARRTQLEMEQRRLREQLRQEQLKSEAMRQYSMARLDVHDQMLGVDTRPAGALPGYQPSAMQALPGGAAGFDPANPWGAQPQQFPQPQAQMPVPEQAAVAWYYEYEGTTAGPVGAEAIHNLLQGGRLTAQTLLWCQDLGDWTPASAVHIFRASIRA